MEFQIKQNYGQGSCAWIYFKVDGEKTIEELKEISVNAMKEDWSKINPALYFFSGPTPAKPTIEVVEYANGKKVRGGIRFKTKWR